MSSPVAEDAFMHVTSFDELRRKGVMVVHPSDRPVAVYCHGDDKVAAVDNRCPHLGFPLHKGSVHDGILTCHWHHARFDLCSGCTFDLWADDVPAYDVKVMDGQVYVSRHPRREAREDYYFRRLEQGMQQGISLIQAKSLLGLLHGGVDYRRIVRAVATFGVKNRDDWSAGMTQLAAMANLVPLLSDQTAYLALYQGTRRVAADCAGQPPRRPRDPLQDASLPPDTLDRWLRYWTTVRHRDGAERTLLTAVQASPAEGAQLLIRAATQRPYAAGGHLLDFVNKACELLDLTGWDDAAAVLPTLVPQLVRARGGEESNEWRHPVDLVPPLREAEAAIPQWLEEGRSKTCRDDKAILAVLLGEDPLRTIDALRHALAEGARPQQVSRVVAYAAALRIARFGTANEFSDWITALHTFSYCNAVDHAAARSEGGAESDAAVCRAILHGAIAVYLDRFLNVPPAKLPGERGTLDGLPADAGDLCQGFLDLLDQRHEVDAAARLVARYLRLDHDPRPLYDTLVLAAVREDADFHTLQMVEAGIRQHGVWQGSPEGEHILVAVARYLAAHSPTERAQQQTAQIALRLHRGDRMYEEES